MIPVDQARIDRNWRAVTVELDAPIPGIFERSLRRCGLPSTVTRVIAATPALRRSWLIAVSAVAVIGLGIQDPTRPDGGLYAFLLVSPLAALLGVAMTYGPEADPAHEIGLATPMKGARLLVIRAFTVQAVATLILGAASLASPAGWRAIGWIVPSIGLTSIALALMTYLSPRRATSLAAVAWLGVVSTIGAIADDRLALFGPAGQLAAAAAAGLALVVLHGRRSRLDVIGGRW